MVQREHESHSLNNCRAYDFLVSLGLSMMSLGKVYCRLTNNHERQPICKCGHDHVWGGGKWARRNVEGRAPNEGKHHGSKELGQDSADIFDGPKVQGGCLEKAWHVGCIK